MHRVAELSLAAPAPRRRRLILPTVLGVVLLAVAAFATVEFVELARVWLTA